MIGVQNVLAALPIFRSCCQDFLHSLARDVPVIAVKPGQTLVREGARGGSLLAVSSGALLVTKDGEPVGRLGVAEYFGEALLLGMGEVWKAGLKADAACAADVKVLEVTRSALTKAMARFPKEATKFEQLYAEYVAPTADVRWGRLRLFRSLSEEAWEEVDRLMLDRLYFPGERLLARGGGGQELCVLAKGAVTVETADKIVAQEQRPLKGGQRAQDPAIFGAAQFLGVQAPQSCTVTATTVCRVRVLHSSVFERALARLGEGLRGLEALRFGQHPATKACLCRFPMFADSGVSGNFLDFLCQNLEDRIYLAEQAIQDGDKPERSLYILRHGTAKVLSGGAAGSALQAGQVFGDLSMAALEQDRAEPAVVVAAGACYVQKLHGATFLQALERFPDEWRATRDLVRGRRGSQEAKSKDLGRPLSLRTAFRQAAAEKCIRGGRCFRETSPRFAELVVRRARERIYFPGDAILVEGARSLLLLLLLLILLLLLLLLLLLFSL